jgi:hypothetical protein
VPNDGLGQIGTRNSKTVVGFTATANLLVQDMDSDQYRPGTPFKTKLVLIHVLLHSLSLNYSHVANDGQGVK